MTALACFEVHLRCVPSLVSRRTSLSLLYCAKLTMAFAGMSTFALITFLELRQYKRFHNAFLTIQCLRDAVDQRLEDEAKITDASSQKIIDLQSRGLLTVGKDSPGSTFDAVYGHLQRMFKMNQASFYRLYDLAKKSPETRYLKLRDRSVKAYLPKQEEAKQA